MANELISKDFGKYKISTVFANAPVENDLSQGITGGFGVVGYKGKTWSYRYRGEEQMLMRDDGDGPRSSFDAVIIAAAKVLSKVWYEAGWVEGNSAPPDCWSGNGVVPSLQSPKRQSETCASCPRNVWGGRITDNGKRAKECADAKRMAVVPVDDVANEAYGGPMLLRVPAASLADMSAYGNEIAKMGFPYYSIATKIQFDPEESYPKFRFMAMRPLNDEEAAIIDGFREDPLIERILDEQGDTVIDQQGDVHPVGNTGPAPTPAKTAPPKAAAKPPMKTINATPAAATKPAAKSKVTPRQAAVARAEEPIEEAQVVDEDAVAALEREVAGDEPAEEEDETFDAALDAKLSAFLGGKK